MASGIGRIENIEPVTMAAQSPDATDLGPALSLLERLVAFRSISAASNLDVIEWVKAQFSSGGARFRQTFNEDRSKANLVVSFGPEDRPGVILSGHVDVVPVDGQTWTTDPFSLNLRDRRAYGRGTTDMKGFLACCMAQLARKPSAELQHPIHLALSYDEELGCLGAPAMVADLARSIPTPILTVVGEPTMMEIITAHKGSRVFETIFKGRAAHSSQAHLGASANVYAAHFVSYLSRVFDDLRMHVTAAHGLVPPYSTFNVGILSGGTALNIIPEDARLVWEFRTIPEIDSEALSSRIHRYLQRYLLARLKAQFPGAAVLSRQLAHVPPLQPSYNRVARDVMCSITRLTGDGAVAYGTEAGIFQQAGFPTVVCGPGTIDVAHKANEHIALEQLARCNQAIEAIIAFCRRP